MFGIVLGICLAPLLVLLLTRVLGLERGRALVALVSLTPYGVLYGAVLAVVAFAARHWVTGGLALAGAVASAAVVAPRALRAAPPAHGAELRILSANLLWGRADANALVELVRRYQPDVVCLQELTADAVDRLKAAGLTVELPYVAFDAIEPGVTGTGLAARRPLRTVAALRNRSVAAVVDPSVEVVAVHATWPMGHEGSRPWSAALAALPRPAPDGPVRVLAGDFNATLDHAALRGLRQAGYRDAAATTGAGLRPTWPSGGHRRLCPPVTIDHVLVDPRCHVVDYDVLDVPGSDHRAVFAVLTLPA